MSGRGANCFLSWPRTTATDQLVPDREAPRSRTTLVEHIACDNSYWKRYNRHGYSEKDVSNCVIQLAICSVLVRPRRLKRTSELRNCNLVVAVWIARSILVADWEERRMIERIWRGQVVFHHNVLE